MIYFLNLFFYFNFLVHLFISFILVKKRIIIYLGWRCVFVLIVYRTIGFYFFGGIHWWIFKNLILSLLYFSLIFGLNFDGYHHFIYWFLSFESEGIITFLYLLINSWSNHICWYIPKPIRIYLSIGF